MDLTTAAREMHELRKELAAHIEASKKREAELRASINDRSRVLESAADGIDREKVALARSIISVRGTYANGGEDRASVISDAVKQLSTGEPIRPTYGDLWHYNFGTKRYDGWYGQRCDCQPGYGPRHGSIIFEIGLTETVRKTRSSADLTPDEAEAAIYYLLNLERVQAAEQRAREVAAA